MNIEATKQNIEATGRTIAGWARSKGLDPERMRNVLRGRYKKILPKEEKALRQDGLLVEDEKQDKPRKRTPA